jgi:DNA-binding transcriptional LysR family regulator
MRSSVATRQGVQAGELDAGFLLASEFEKGLTGLVLKQLEYRIAGPQAWADSIENADWKALAALPWIVTAPGTSNHEMRESLFRVHGLEVKATIEANNDLLLRSLIADGIGIGMVRTDHAEEGARKGIFALSPLGSAHTDLRFAYAEARKADPVIQAVAKGVSEIWSTDGSSAG